MSRIAPTVRITILAIAVVAAAVFCSLELNGRPPGLLSTIHNAKAGDYGLRIGLIWWAIGIALAIGYFVFTYRQVAGKVNANAEHEGY
jgi:cytochrome d ubiquinol oxidase subunit II